MVIKFLSEMSSIVVLSYRSFKRLLRPAYIGPFVGLVALPFLSMMKFGDPLFFYVDIVGGSGRFSEGAVTVFGSMFLVVAGVFFLVASRLFYLIRMPPPLVVRSQWWWIVAGMSIIYLGLDEILMIHEYLTWKMQDINVPRLFGIDQDIYVFAFYGIVGLVVVIKLLPVVYYYRRAVFPLVAAFIFMGATQTFDFIPWASLTPGQQLVLGPLEEILKTMGEWSLLLYAGLLIEEIVTMHAPEVFQHG